MIVRIFPGQVGVDGRIVRPRGIVDADDAEMTPKAILFGSIFATRVG